MFSVHTTPEELPFCINTTITGHFGFALRKIRKGKLNDNRGYSVFGMLPLQNVFSPHENEKAAFSNSSGSNSGLQKLRFCDDLMWTVGPKA